MLLHIDRESAEVFLTVSSNQQRDVMSSLPYIALRGVSPLPDPIATATRALSADRSHQMAVFGVSIPFLPNLLTDTVTVGSTEEERVASVLERWIDFVANLWKWQHAAFSLRFLVNPSAGAIELALLCRVAGSPGQETLLSTMLHTDLQVLGAQLTLPLQPLQTPVELHRFLDPFPQGALLEVRQGERLEVVQLEQEYDIYVVYRSWEPSGDWIALCEMLIRQPNPVLLNLHIEPTHLYDYERGMLSRAAGFAADLADFTYRGMYYKDLRIRNPHAEVVSRVYAANSRRLHEPFLTLAQVTSPDPTTAMTVARALSTAISTRNPSSSHEESNLPVQNDVVVPRNNHEYRIARETLTGLYLNDWGDTHAYPDQIRLRYLSDARGVAARFRFPIALRSGIPGIVTRQIAPAFHLGPQKTEVEPDEILLGNAVTGGFITVKRDDLVRHALVAGFTRSGKTNSCLNLLDQLWRNHHIPFLVIEPVKTEYRGLIQQQGFEKLLIFTLGDESVAPFRINPFELLPGVKLEAHIGALQACFEAALPQFGVLPMLIEEAIHEVYARAGWYPKHRGVAGDPPRPYPTLRDLYNTLSRTVAGYAGEVKQNLQTALEKRVGSLLRGSKGRMFNTQRTIPLDLLMSRPVVLELDQLGQQEQPLAMLFLLMFVREYRRLHQSRALQHVTLIEEAHLIMGQVQPVTNPEVAPNTGGASAEQFERLLAEIGGSGEGVIIVEQSPSMLVRGAMNNTGLKIAHQIIGHSEVEAIGNAMVMEPEQKRKVQTLQVGHAAVFMSGFEKPTFIEVPAYKRDRQYDDQMNEEELIQHMQVFYQQYPDLVLPFQGCTFCRSRCFYRAAIESQTTDKNLHKVFYDRWQVLRSQQQERTAMAYTAWREFISVMKEAAKNAGYANLPDAAWCYWVQQAGDSFTFQQFQRERFDEMIAIDSSA